jgi:hypothetical protein
MAFLVGTASNMEDLFTRILDFLTTNAGLVTAGQKWEILRQSRDNLDSATTNASTPTPSPTEASILQVMRTDSRRVNRNENRFGMSGVVGGTTFIRCKLKVAKEVKKIGIRSLYSTSTCLGNFRLQYSDDDSAWTTALTVNSSPIYTPDEYKEFSVPGTSGSHLYWRVLVDTLSNGSTSGTMYLAGLSMRDSLDEAVNNFGSEAILKGFGNSGTEEFYVGIRSEYNLTYNWHNLVLNGYTGFNSSESSWFKQPGAIPDYSVPAPALWNPLVPLWNSSMPFWFSATGRSFRMGVKVSTNYESAYLGLIMPYSTPKTYPYPLFVGGSMLATGDQHEDWRYSNVSGRHSCLNSPSGDTSSSGVTSENISATAYIRSATGEWNAIYNRLSSDGRHSMTRSLTPPYALTGEKRIMYPDGSFPPTSYRPHTTVYGGGYLLEPMLIMQRLPTPLVLGEMEGLFCISGFGSAAENTTTFDSVDHIILQNVGRNTPVDFWAMSLNP